MTQNVRYLFTEDTVAQEIKTDTAKKLGISDCLSLHPFDLSAGQAQKLALGILLEQGTDIFLLDEPSKAFDERSKRKLAELLKSLCSDGKTVIIVTHDIDFAGEVSDYVSFFVRRCDKHGRGTPAGIFFSQILHHADKADNLTHT